MSSSTPTPTAIISYSHDSDSHRESILALAQSLRENGIDCTLDRFVDPTDWALWMETEIRKRDWVLVVATETYLNRARKEEEARRGLGVSWEYGDIRQTLYEARGGNPKFVPIVFGRDNAKYIPEALRGRTYYDVTDLGDFNRLVNKLAGLPITEQPIPLGALPSGKVMSVGMESHLPPRTNLPKVDKRTGGASIRPRLYLKVSVYTPGFIAVNNGPVTKLGSYKLNLEIWNKGKGAANKVRAVMTGAIHLQRLGTIAPGDKPLRFTWTLEDQEAYLIAPQFPAVTVEYIDDDGVPYRQLGPLQVKRLSNAFGYEGGNLEAPEAVESLRVPYGD